ncbi:MAG: hypothetical protein KF678_04545 [Phycisphaeraceae bacterium]|nr:hypothetical protein [Phycisphaeraceae bacterium]
MVAPFLNEAQGVLQELRPALSGILEGLSPPARRASELRRRLELDQSLSWSVFSAATAGDSRVLASLLPGRRAMERFFSAAELHGVPADAVARARRAFERFENLVARHAGSRDAFEAMVSEQGATPVSSSDLKHKRAAFRANSLMWGRQARVFCATKIVHPSAAGLPMLDGVFIKGMVGLHRTRQSVPLYTAAHHWRTANAGESAVPNPPEPLDPRESGPDAVGLLRDFCSQPLPEFRLTVSRQGYRSHTMVGHGLGPADEVTYFTGEARRAEGAAPGTMPGAEVMLFKVVDLPLEVFCGDILMHRDVWGTRPPEVRVYAHPLDGSTEFREHDLLSLTERAEYLGDGIGAAATPLVPRYGEILGYAMKRMGWRPEEFRVFRCRVEYPVLYTRIRLTLA